MKQKSFLTKILAVLLAAAFFAACPAHIVRLQQAILNPMNMPV